MENISKLILDDSGYLPKLQTIKNEWYATAEAEQKATQISTDAIEKRVEGLDVIDKKFVRNAATIKQSKTAEEAHAKAIKQSTKSTTTYDKTITKITGTVSGWITKLKGAKKSEQELAAVKAKNKAIYAESVAGLKEQIGQTTLLGTNMGQLGTTIKAAIAVGRAWIATLGLTKIALIATGIGAFVVILGSLIAYLKNTVEGQDFLNRKMAAAGAVIASLKDVAISMGKAIFDAVSNPLQAIKNFGKGVTEFIQNPAKKALEMWNKLKGEVRAIAEDAANDASAAEALARREQILRDDLRGQEIQAAKVRAEAEKLRAVGADVNKGLKERTAALEEANTKEILLMAEQMRLSQENLDIIREKNALATSGNEDLDAEKDAEVALVDLRKTSLAKQRALTTQLAGIRKQAHQAFLANQKAEDDAQQKAFEQRKQQLLELKGDYAALAQSLMDNVFGIEFDQASPIEKVRIREAKALDEIAKTRENFNAVSKKALLEGLVTQEDVDKQLANLDIIEAVTKQKFGQEKELIELPVKAIAKLDIKKIDVPKADASGIADRIGKAFSEPLKKSFREGVQDALDGAVGFFEENKEQFEAFKGFFNDLTSLFTSGIDSQIAKIDELVAKQDEKISELEDQIEQEEEAVEAGLSNNLTSLQTQLDEENAKREESLAQKQALEKKAAKAQLVNDLVQQSSSLITASAGIFKAMSSIPFVGVPLAIGFIATMFAAFAKSKIDASKAAKLYKGTGRIDEHFKTKTYVGSKSDLYGNGYAVTDADTGEDMGVRISGKEPLINEAVGQGVNRSFFESLNDNPAKWQNFDISKALAAGRQGIQKVKETTVFAEKGATEALNVVNTTNIFEAAASVENARPEKEKPFIQFLAGEPTHQIIIEGGIRTILPLN